MNKDAMEMTGVAAVVTEGASGLGGTAARGLAASGARVTVFDRNEEAGARTAAQIGRRHRTVGPQGAARARCDGR